MRQAWGNHEGSKGNYGGNGSLVADIIPRAITATPEDRREPEPGQIFARVRIHEIRSGPDDDDFVIV